METEEVKICRTQMQRVAKPASLEDDHVFDILADKAVTSNSPHLR